MIATSFTLGHWRAHGCVAESRVAGLLGAGDGPDIRQVRARTHSAGSTRSCLHPTAPLERRSHCPHSALCLCLTLTLAGARAVFERIQSLADVSSTAPASQRTHYRCRRALSVAERRFGCCVVPGVARRSLRPPSSTAMRATLLRSMRSSSSVACSPRCSPTTAWRSGCPNSYRASRRSHSYTHHNMRSTAHQLVALPPQPPYQRNSTRS